jgi:hypothetical protein
LKNSKAERNLIVRLLKISILVFLLTTPLLKASVISLDLTSIWIPTSLFGTPSALLTTNILYEPEVSSLSVSSIEEFNVRFSSVTWINPRDPYWELSSYRIPASSISSIDNEVLGKIDRFILGKSGAAGFFDPVQQQLIFDVSGGDFISGDIYQVIPEPSALSLLAVGLGGLAMMRRRRS